jgi:thiol oxidase
MNEAVYEREIASLVEFYNSYCGACMRFSSIYKSLAKNVTKWKSFVQVAAIDCATDENNDVCREYEVMRYPTFRYFPPKYSKEKGEKKLGVNLDYLLVPTPELLFNELVTRLYNETNGGSDWPKFEKFVGDNWNEILNTVPAEVQYVYVLSDDLPATLPEQIVLDYANHGEKFAVRIVDASNLNLIDDQAQFRLGVVIKSSGRFQSLPIHNETRDALNAAIDNHIKIHHLAAQTTESGVYEIISEDSVASQLDTFYYEKASSMSPMPLFRADLEQAIKNSLGHEVTQHQVIEGENLSALRSFVSVLTRYYNFGNKNSYKKLLDFLMEPSRTQVQGDELQSFLKNLNSPIIHESRYIGCFSTRVGARRFPCSLWSLFHHLTVQHLDSDYNDDPMEVLHAMHGYIKYFFGCTECSKHFQEMAKRNHIWNVTSKDQAVLWLWSAHNEVNNHPQCKLFTTLLLKLFRSIRDCTVM